MDTLEGIILILTCVAPVLQYLVLITQSFAGFPHKPCECLVETSENDPTSHRSVAARLREDLLSTESIETHPLPPSPSKDMAPSKLKSFMKRLKRKRRGYNGVHQRAKQFISTRQSPTPAELGSCFQCGLHKSLGELQDQTVVGGHVVGICNDCYPEFIQFLQEEEAGDISYVQEPRPSSSRPTRSQSLQPFYTESPMPQDEDIGEAEDDENERSSNDAVKECGVCGEGRLDYLFVAATYNCQHEINYCTSCLQNWISASLESRGWDNIRCPESDCSAKLEAENIQQHADKETFEKYSFLSTKAALGAVPDFIYCLRPGCESGQLHETGSDGPIFRCHACNFKACVIHNTAWHGGETCKEFDYRTNPKIKNAEEKASKETIKKTTKKCPQRACGAPIEKNDGCDHMTCRKCRHEFCWLCLAPYESIRRQGNTAHNPTCNYYRP